MDPRRLIGAGTAAWNAWRTANPMEIADLRGIDLRDRDLRGAQLNDALLRGSDLSRTNLSGASLCRTDLRGVQLTRADLRAADLRCAVLGDVVGAGGSSMIDITDADFSDATFGWTFVGDIYLGRITGLGRIRHAGPSYVTTSTLELTSQELRKHGTIRSDLELFLQRAGVLLQTLGTFERVISAAQSYSAFISYAHSDKAFALWLEEALRKRRIRCWLDEKNMRPGERILDSIAGAIASHDRVLLCCSRSSLDSWWVQDEIRKAHDIERERRGQLLIIPLLLDDYLIKGWQNGLASDLRSRLGLDFAGFPDTSQCKPSLERLLLALEKSRTSAHADPADA
jgi:TIR domain/Pentapeptide repeats (8 copies)